MSRCCGNIVFSKNNEKIYDHLTVKGIFNENKIIYVENDITVTLLIFDNKIQMKRETVDYVIDIPFEVGIETEGTYLLKEYEKSLRLKIITEKMNYQNNKIEINYSLSIEDEEPDEFSFSLELEV